ncbi:MAG: MgtC/SapB family protein [Clostridia bacterium]|nr:MgtC/SapB family protein [Clostridia bacterium]
MALNGFEIALRLLAAVIASGIIGYERETGRHPAGIRTHILVCVGAAMVALLETITAVQVFEMSAQTDRTVSLSFGRLSAQVISGVGFLGAGTIITTKRSTAGLTTAASVWSVACLGLAAGMGHYILCMIGTACIYVVLSVIKRIIVVRTHKVVEVSFTNPKETLLAIQEILAAWQIHVHNIDFQVSESENGAVYTNTYMLDLPKMIDGSTLVNRLSEFETVQKVRMRDP